MRKVGLGWLVATWVCGVGALGVWGCSSESDCASSRTCGASAGTSSSGGGNAGKGSTGGSDAGQGGGSSGGTSSSGTSSGGSVSGGGSGGGVGASGMGGEGGSDGGACKGDVSDDAACWTTEEYGVFVSSDTGNDETGEGTRAAPYKTLGRAVTATGGKHVYVCLGTQQLSYPEKLSLMDGVRIYGGFECEGWTYSTSRSALVAPPKDNVALRITSVKKSVYIENVRFQSAAGSGAGLDASSYGALITDSTDVVLKRVELTAGAGKEGAKGTDGLKGDDGAVAGEAQKGEAAICVDVMDGLPGKWPGEICGSKEGNGGGGARPGKGAPGLQGSPSTNVEPPNQDNGGAAATVVNTKGGDGTEGASGTVGAVGVAAAKAGEFLAGGFMPSNGTAGKDGFPGQGGGGGGASMGNATCRGASGGAGGMGGCGGKPGTGGYGGGASVGLFSWQSAVTLDACKVTAGDGGAGGPGGKGGAGASGASGGAGGNGINVDTNKIGPGGQGGRGGSGGQGGPGSGGTGGPSHALVFSGTKPSYVPASTTLKSGKGGAAGAGGQSDAQAPDGFKGDEALELEVK